MQGKKRKVIIITISILLILAVISVTCLNLFQKKNIHDIYKIYNNEDVQNRLDKESNQIGKDSVTNDSLENIIEKRNNENVLGIIKIDKINYEGLIYEGTSLSTLSKGVGHFENSSYFEGNVCLANHNTIGQWSKLHTLEIGDIISYTSFLGSKQYRVESIKQIEETNWDMLRETKDNRITLITCIKGKPALRLCVQAIEVN